MLEIGMAFMMLIGFLRQINIFWLIVGATCSVAACLFIYDSVIPRIGINPQELRKKIKKILSFALSICLYIALNCAGCAINYNLNVGDWIKDHGNKTIKYPFYLPLEGEKVNYLINYFENYQDGFVSSSGAGGIAVVQLEIDLDTFKTKENMNMFDKIVYSIKPYVSDNIVVDYYGTNKNFDYIYHTKYRIKLERPSVNIYTYYTLNGWTYDESFCYVTYKLMQGNLINICWFLIMGITLIGGFMGCGNLYFYLTTGSLWI